VVLGQTDVGRTPGHLVLVGVHRLDVNIELLSLYSQLLHGLLDIALLLGVHLGLQAVLAGRSLRGFGRQSIVNSSPDDSYAVSFYGLKGLLLDQRQHLIFTRTDLVL